MKSEADQVISVERQCRRRVDGNEIGSVSLCIWGPRGRESQCRESHGWAISTLRQSSGLLGFTLGVVVCMNKAAFPQVQRLLHSGFDRAPV